jgi:DNA-binding PadR family transcriptional regulator
MSLDHILLGMLRKPATGYELKKEFEEGPRHFWSAELSQIYPALQAMEKRGWLASRSEPSPRGPARRVYRRTAAGARALHDWLRGEPQFGAERIAYIGQLIFMGELKSRSETERFLRQLRSQMAVKADLLRSAGLQFEERSPEEMSDSEIHEYLSVKFGIRTMTARLAACDECLKIVQSRPRRPTK